MTKGLQLKNKEAKKQKQPTVQGVFLPTDRATV
jgi:hypothetical protein